MGCELLSSLHGCVVRTEMIANQASEVLFVKQKCVIYLFSADFCEGILTVYKCSIFQTKQELVRFANCCTAKLRVCRIVHCSFYKKLSHFLFVMLQNLR